MKQCKGFSLIEMLVALLMAGLLVIVLTNVVIGNQVASTTQKGISELQNNGRFAISWLNHDLRMAGNVSLTYSRAPIHLTTTAGMAPTITDNCFTSGTQAFDWARALLPLPAGHPSPTVYGIDNVATTNTVFSGCVDGADLQPGSDLISVHFAEGAEVEDADLEDGEIYINSGLGGAIMFQCNADGTDCKNNLADARDDASGTTNHRIVSRLYFVRSWSDTDGDGIPALVRAILEADGDVSQEVLIKGVASLQVLYGLDTNNSGHANRYMTAAQIPALSTTAGAVQWTKVKSVKTAILMQSTDVDRSLDATANTFDVLGTDVQLTGTFRGQVFSTTVAIRNPTARVAS